MEKGGVPMFRTVLGKLGRALLLLFFLVIAYLLVILLNPSGEEQQEPQALLSPSPAIYLQDTSLREMISAFPVPVLAAGGETVLTPEGGESRDHAFENGFGRVLTLHYLYGEYPVDVISIYPARALELLGRGRYHIASLSSPLLAGWNSVRMEDQDTVRIHMQTGYGIYAVVIPRRADNLLLEIIRPLQLMTVSQDPIP